MSYIKEKLIPGYTGKFVISLHKASHDHFDLRLSFPVSSVSKALADYSGKRPKKGVEPTPETPDKPGIVLRSWAIPKHRLPGNKPLLASETENHAIQYEDFVGFNQKKIIPEGQYGAGTVELVDKGIYTLNKVDYDKKYVFSLSGKNIKGTYALVKTGGKSWLWIKTKDQKKACISDILRKVASGIDYVRPTMIPEIWDLSKDPPPMKDPVKADLLDVLIKSLEKDGFNDPMKMIEHLYASGSSTGFNYKEDGDFDVDVECSLNKIREIYAGLKDSSDKEIKDKIQPLLDKNRETKVKGTNLTYSFMLLEEGDFPGSDGVYDIMGNRWLNGPIKIPIYFDPDEAFVEQKNIAIGIMEDIYNLFAQIKITVKDLKRIDQYNKLYGRLDSKRVMILAKLQDLCGQLASYRETIWRIHSDSKNRVNPYFPAFDYSSDWDEKYIIFKYIARYGGHEPVQYLYNLMGDDPYLPLIKSFMPADAVGRFF